MFIFYFYINVNLVKRFWILKFFYIHTNKKQIIYQPNNIKDKIHSGIKTKKSF